MLERVNVWGRNNSGVVAIGSLVVAGANAVRSAAGWTVSGGFMGSILTEIPSVLLSISFSMLIWRWLIARGDGAKLAELGSTVAELTAWKTASLALPIGQQLSVRPARNVYLSGNVLTFSPQVESHIDFPLAWDALRLEVTCVHLDNSLRAFVSVDAATLAPRETWIGSGQAVCRVVLDDRMVAAIREVHTAGTVRIGQSLQMRVRFAGYRPRGGDFVEVQGGSSEIVTLCEG